MAKDEKENKLAKDKQDQAQADAAAASKKNAAPTPAPKPKGGKKDDGDSKLSVDPETAKEKERQRKAQMQGGGSSQASLREMTEDLEESAKTLGEQIRESLKGGGDEKTSGKDAKGSAPDMSSAPDSPNPNAKKGSKLSMGDDDTAGADESDDLAISQSKRKGTTEEEEPEGPSQSLDL